MARVRVKVPKAEEPTEPVSSDAAITDEAKPIETQPSLDDTPEESAEETKPPGKPAETSHPPLFLPRQAPLSPPPAPGIVVSPKMLVIAGLLLLAAFIAVILLVSRDDDGSNTAADPKASQAATADAEAEAVKYHEEIRSYTDVPADQTPSLVAVTDPAKLAEKSPVLFKNAQKDDVVLFYLNPDKTGKAVLYRPLTKKLIAIVDGVNLNPGTSSTEPATNAMPARPAR